MYNPLNPFSPEDCIAHIRRQIKIRRTSETEKEKWIYEFIEASPIGDTIKPGDWIVIPDKEVRRVIDVQENYLTLTLPIATDESEKNNEQQDDNDNPETKDKDVSVNNHNDSIQCIYYRNLDPLEYYLSVLGVYLYQLFFVGIWPNTISEPNAIKSLRSQLKSTPSLRDEVHKILINSVEKKVFFEGIEPSRMISGIYSRLTALYLILILPEARNFYRDTNPLENLDSEFWSSICEDLIKCLDLPKNYFFEWKYIREFSTDSNQSEIGKRQNVLENKGPIKLDELDLSLLSHVREILISGQDIGSSITGINTANHRNKNKVRNSIKNYGILTRRNPK